MNKTLIMIKASYEALGKSEKKIADWVLSHPDEILPISISELADKSSSSEATIVRFSKRFGFSGFQDFKISFADYTETKSISANIERDDSCFDVFSKVTEEIYTALEKTKLSINRDALEKASEAISNAPKLVIFGLGNSASVALDASHKFLRAGINAYAYSDNHMQAIAASHLTNGDVAMGISHSGSSIDVVEAMKNAKAQGAVTVALTSAAKSPLAKVSDIVLSTVADETKYSILALNSRIVQLTIIDSLYFHIICKRDKSAIEAIKATETSLKDKKY
ncbi:MAG: MurR/RpiR family transcriptional regulator [Clostridia bacterium]|nr:MurR/RpiR family transcriptional regulator [Clostridia bacterium]